MNLKKIALITASILYTSQPLFSEPSINQQENSEKPTIFISLDTLFDIPKEAIIKKEAGNFSNIAKLLEYSPKTIMEGLSKQLDKYYQAAPNASVYHDNTKLPKVLLYFFTQKNIDPQNFYRTASKRFSSWNLLFVKALKIALKYSCTKAINSVMVKNKRTFKLIEELVSAGYDVRIIGNYSGALWKSFPLKKELFTALTISDGTTIGYISGITGLLYPSQQLFQKIIHDLGTLDNTVFYDSESQNLKQLPKNVMIASTPQQLKKLTGLQ